MSNKRSNINHNMLVFSLICLTVLSGSLLELNKLSSREDNNIKNTITDKRCSNNICISDLKMKLKDDVIKVTANITNESGKTIKDRYLKIIFEEGQDYNELLVNYSDSDSDTKKMKYEAILINKDMLKYKDYKLKEMSKEEIKKIVEVD